MSEEIETADEFEDFLCRSLTGNMVTSSRSSSISIPRRCQSAMAGETSRQEGTADDDDDDDDDVDDCGLYNKKTASSCDEAIGRESADKVSKELHRRLLSNLTGSDDLDWTFTRSRPRVCSMPTQIPRPAKLVELRSNPRDDVYKVRSYSITRKGLIKKGEELVRRRSSLSQQSLESEDLLTGALSTLFDLSYKVLFLGASGVGKRALIHEFMMPEDAFISLSLDEDADKTVSILLDGEESTMDFVDISDVEVDGLVTAEPIDAYVVVYSVEDRKSFETAIDRLYEIRKEETRQVALILVANKTDLVRTRVVLEEEGKSAAASYDCKYIEVSAAIDHKTDELLVGILKQIRLIKNRPEKSTVKGRRKSKKDEKDSETCCPLKARQNVLGRLFGGEKKPSSKSCDNLYVL